MSLNLVVIVLVGQRLYVRRKNKIKYFFDGNVLFFSSIFSVSTQTRGKMRHGDIRDPWRILQKMLETPSGKRPFSICVSLSKKARRYTLSALPKNNYKNYVNYTNTTVTPYPDNNQ
jgi:hypothetical protein